jgi:hypothetical protein
MADITSLRLSDAVALGAELRALAEGTRTMEGAARRIVDHLYEHMRRGEERTFALVRLFKTHPSADLGPELTAAARRISGERPLPPSSSALVLMATRGEDPAWNDRRASNGHQAIPLPDESFVVRIPMIAEVFRQFGVPLSSFIERDEAAFQELERIGCNNFLVEEAAQSPFIPAKDFVKEHGIRSVLAFGGVLPRAQIFVVLLFSKVPVRRETAELLKPLSLNVKLALLPLCQARTFDE